MTHKLFNSDRRGVSPVIGVILMVAITVILAAVIGTFVLGLGDSVGNSAPQAQFNYEYADTGETGFTWVNITHQGGDPIDNSTIDIVVGGDSAFTTSTHTIDSSWGAKATAGTTMNINASASSGDTVQIVWTSADGQKSAVISESEVA